MSLNAIEVEDDDDFETGFISENLINCIEEKNIKQLLICPLFPHILKSPIKCPVCETHFCSKCLQKSLEINGKCPICRSEIPEDQKQREPSKILLFLLDNLKISCENLNKGCLEKFMYNQNEEFTNHVNEKCLYTDVSCTNFKCEFKCIRKDIDAHQKECEKEKLDCQFCKKQFPRNKIKEHIDNGECSQICKWCTQRFLLEAEPNHIQECDLMLILCLKCQKVFYRKDIQKHNDWHSFVNSSRCANSAVANSLDSTYFARRDEQRTFFLLNQQRNNSFGLTCAQPFSNPGNSMYVATNSNPNKHPYSFFVKRS